MLDFLMIVSMIKTNNLKGGKLGAGRGGEKPE